MKPAKILVAILPPMVISATDTWLEQQLAGPDLQHSGELCGAQRNQARPRDQLAIADVRLSVLLAADSVSGCNVPATSGVHAVLRPRLDPAQAQRSIGVTGDGDQELIVLAACQAYVRKVIK